MQTLLKLVFFVSAFAVPALIYAKFHYHWNRWLLFGSMGLVVLLCLSLADSVGERNYLQSVIEIFFAYLIYPVVIFGPVAAGVWLGVKVAARSQQNWLGWITGITTYLILGVAGLSLVTEIPGIGWRIQAILDNGY